MAAVVFTQFEPFAISQEIAAPMGIVRIEKGKIIRNSDLNSRRFRRITPITAGTPKIKCPTKVA
jgi:hypothetical protein